VIQQRDGLAGALKTPAQKRERDMRQTILAAGVATFVALMFANSAGAAELRLFGGGHFQGSGKDVAEAFTKKTGIAATYTPGNTGGPALPKRLKDGEQMDVIVMNRDDMNGQVKDGLIKADSVVSFANDRYGVAVLKGAPKPDVSTKEKFRAVLLAAKAVGMQDHDPAHIHSGVVMYEILPKLGIADQMKSKTVLINDPASAIIAGKVDFNIWTAAEIMAQPKLDLAGLVPAELGGVTEMSVGILTTNKNDADAKAFIKFITSADGAAAWNKHGLEPLSKTKN
jgi:molybdate transport system substrate-binding protein